jgi:glycosyltransferase involved in cell wall biosynthesis
MRILFLTTQLPYPPKSGGIIKTWRLLEHWSKMHEVTLVHPLKEVDHEYITAFKTEELKLKEHYYEEVIRPRSPLSLVQSYLGHASLNVYRNHSKGIEKKIHGMLEKQDLVFIDHYELGQYIPKGISAKVILHEHNAEYIMWSRLSEIEQNPIKRAILVLESKRIAKAECKYASVSDQVWAAPNDQIELEKIGVPKEKMRTTYHLGEDFMMDIPDMEFQSTEKRILFIGTLTWEANVDGLLWFFKEIWPELKKEGTLKLDIIGKNPDPRLIQAALGDDNVSFLGFIEDLEPYYLRSRVFIVPLRFGSGIKVKLLNAMYRGIPTVTTEIGTEGLEVTNGKELYQTSSPIEFSSRIKELMSSESCWNSMRDEARIKARKYTWKSLLNAHDEHLSELGNNTI